MSGEDKAWFEQQFDTKLASLEDRIDTKLVSLEDRIDTKFDTKLASLEDRLDKKFDTKLISLKDEMIEQMRDIETTLLKEFQKWASLSDVRARSHDASIRALGAQFEALEDRVAKLESKTH